MNRRTTTGFATLAVAGAFVLGACGTDGSSWTVPNLADDSKTANVKLIGDFDCAQTQTAITQLGIAVNEHDTEKQNALGVTDDNKDAIATALKERESKACADAPASDPNAALKGQAKEICDGDGTVADCKKRGTTAFEYLKGKNLQGDPNVRSTPAGFHKELTGLADKPESLSKAIELAGTLIGYEKIAKEGGSVDNPATAAQIHALFPNANQDDVNVGTEGEHAVNWDLNSQEERGGASFGEKTLKTQADIREFLNGTSAESQAAREHVTQAIKAEGYGDDEVARALNGDGYIPVQLKGASQILGTSYFVDGKVLILGKWRQAAEGDVYWLFFTKDGKLIRGALLRADCDNPDAITIMVVRPGMPPAPPVDQPPGEETCPPGTIVDHETGLCKPPPPPGDCDKPDDCKPPKYECPPEYPHGKPPNCKDGTGNLPTYGPGPGTNIDPGSGEYVDPGDMEQPPATSRVNPPPVTTTKPAPPPVVQPTVIPTQPTVQPSTQPTNTGTLPGGPGCGNPELC